MLDALESLLSNACVPAAALQSRAMFEASVYMDFILLGEEEEKSRCFYVSSLRTDLLWATRTRMGDPGAKDFIRSLGEFGESFQRTEAEHRVELDKQAAAISEFLGNEPWAAINAMLQAARGKRKHDVQWYVPFGQGSVRDLCRRLGRLHEYEVFYSAFSEKMHSSDYKSHMSIGNGFVTFEPIRNLSGAHVLLNYSMSVAFHAYRAILHRYRPGQLVEFAQRYKENWRELYLRIPSVNYAPGARNHL